MKKSVKIFSTLLIMAIIICTFSTFCFATTVGGVTIPAADSSKTDVSDIAQKAANIVKTLQMIAAIAAVIIIAILGIKYMLGSVEERAEYKKSFMPLIIGVIVVVLATQIAAVIFNLAQ